jgi:hypothetical protein
MTDGKKARKGSRPPVKIKSSFCLYPAKYFFTTGEKPENVGHTFLPVFLIPLPGQEVKNLNFPATSYKTDQKKMRE